MKYIVLVVLALAACDKPIANSVSVEKGKQFAISEGYDNLKMHTASTLCYKPLGSKKAYGPTFYAKRNGQDVVITICEKIAIEYACEKNDLLCRGGKTRIARIDRSLVVETH
jgi:hypothetical protein